MLCVAHALAVASHAQSMLRCCRCRGGGMTVAYNGSTSDKLVMQNQLLAPGGCDLRVELR